MLHKFQATQLVKWAYFHHLSYIYLIVGIVGWLTNNVGRWIGSEIGSSS